MEQQCINIINSSWYYLTHMVIICIDIHHINMFRGHSQRITIIVCQFRDIYVFFGGENQNNCNLSLNVIFHTLMQCRSL